MKSLKFRILAILGVTLALCAASIVVFIEFSRQEDAARPLLDHLSRYTEYLADDIGSPPNLTRAQEISDRIRIKIAIFHGEISWKTDKQMKIPEEARAALVQSSSLVTPSSYFIYFLRGPFTYVFEIPKIHELHFKVHWVILLILVLIGILGAGSYAVVSSLRPIQWIYDFTRKMRRGDLSARVPLLKGDELGNLGVEINELASRFQNLLESKRQLLLAISHEVRTPLTRAIVSAEFIEDVKVRESLVRDLKEMSQLTEEILEAESVSSQHFRLNRESVYASQLLEELVRERFSTQRDRVELQLTESSETWSCDIARLKLVLRNLIENALNHSGRSEKKIVVSLKETKEKVLFSVRDFGKGVAPEHIPHLTEAFYRTDSSRRRHTGGYGLGLYLCRMVVEAHGGRIQIDSKIDEGTEISIEFPRATKSPN